MEYKSSKAYVKDVYEYFKEKRLMNMSVTANSWIKFNDCACDELSGITYLEFEYKGEVIGIEVCPTDHTRDNEEPFMLIKGSRGNTETVVNDTFSVGLRNVLRREMGAVSKVTLNTDFEWNPYK